MGSCRKGPLRLRISSANVSNASLLMRAASLVEEEIRIQGMPIGRLTSPGSSAEKVLAMALSVSWTRHRPESRQDRPHLVEMAFTHCQSASSLYFIDMGVLVLSSRPRHSTEYSSRASEDLSRAQIPDHLTILNLNISEKAMFTWKRHAKYPLPGHRNIHI